MVPLDEKNFILITDVHEIIHHESVRDYCEELSQSRVLEHCPELVNYVCGQSAARCVFAIIILMGEPCLLCDLAQDKVCDKDLPLSYVEEDGVDFQLARRSNPTVPIECFRKWTTAQRKSFDVIQRQVKAVLQQWPIKLPVTVLSDCNVLPLTECKEIYRGNSTVYRVQIHQAHHQLDGNDEVQPHPHAFSMSINPLENQIIY